MQGNSTANYEKDAFTNTFNIENRVYYQISDFEDSKDLIDSQDLISFNFNWSASKVEEKEIQTISKEKSSKRNDIAHKSLLRQIRKYYSTMFRQNNRKIIKSRFRNVKTNEALEAVKATFGSEFNLDGINNDLWFYLVGVIKVKNIHRITWSDNAKNEAFQFLDWWREFSKVKLAKLKTSQLFKIIWRNYISKNTLDGEDLIFFKELTNDFI